MEFDRMPVYTKEKYENQFEFTGTEVLMKPNISKEAVQEFLCDKARFTLTGEDFSNPDKVSTFMINEFKASKCYNKKSETDRNEIINYLKENPYFDDFSDVIFYDNNGNTGKIV